MAKRAISSWMDSQGACFDKRVTAMEIQRPGNLPDPNTNRSPVVLTSIFGRRQWRKSKNRWIVCTRVHARLRQDDVRPSFWATSSGITLQLPWPGCFECQPELIEGVRANETLEHRPGDPTPAVIRAQCAFLHNPSPGVGTGFALARRDQDPK